MTLQCANLTDITASSLDCEHDRGVVLEDTLQGMHLLWIADGFFGHCS